MSRRIADVAYADHYCRSGPRIGTVGIERAAYFDAVLVKIPFAIVHKGEYALIFDVPGVGKEVIDNVLDVLDNTVLLPETFEQGAFFSIICKYHSKALFHSSPLIKACCKAS